MMFDNFMNFGRENRTVNLSGGGYPAAHEGFCCFGCPMGGMQYKVVF